MIARVAARLSALSLGLLAGAMLLIAVAIAPFWSELPPAQFRAWFGANSYRIAVLMFPLGGLAAAASATALVAALRGSSKARRAFALAAAAALAVVAVTLLVNEPSNVRFATPGALTDEQTIAELRRWIGWHWIRLAFGGAGFFAAVHGLSHLPPDGNAHRPRRRRR